MSGYNDVIDAALEALKLGRDDIVAQALEALRPDTAKISVASIYGAKSGKPFVEIRVADRLVTQWSPGEARDHASKVLEAAESAEQDAFFITYLLERVGGDLETSGRLLQEFRAYRAAQREKS